MRTLWTFMVILYLTQVFHATSGSSASIVASPTQTAQHRVSEPSAAPARATRQSQPPRNNSTPILPKGENVTSATKAPVVPPSQSLADYIRNFHHGTLATRAPMDKNNNTLFGWHTTIYTLVDGDYEQICGGSLVKRNTAISAAHCFWDEAGLMPASLFAAGIGSARRRWQYARQYRTNISEIIVPPRFLGITTNFQDDIAVVRLASPVDYQFGVKPVCVDFDLDLERWHLSPNYHGLVTGFGLTEENGRPSEVLNYQRLPYVDIRDCIAASEPGFLKYLTSDKICAGDQKTGRALCRGDSGGGLVFFFGFIETAIMYLRGVASAAPRNDNACNAYAIGSFTHLRTHRTFLREHIPGLEEECRTFYAKELASAARYKLKPVQTAGNKTGANEDSKMNDGIIDSGNNVMQPVKSNSSLQVITKAPVDVKDTDRLTTDVDQTANFNKPDAVPKETNGGITMSISNAVRLQKPDFSTDLHGPLKGAVTPSVSVTNGTGQEGIFNEVKGRGNPNTNIIFFTGPVLDPSKVYSQADGPVVVNSKPEQPTNIYVFIQN